MKARIEVMGCDGSTRVRRDLTKSQLAFMLALCEDVDKTAVGHCQPSMSVQCVKLDGNPDYYNGCEREPGHDGDCRGY